MWCDQLAKKSLAGHKSLGAGGFIKFTASFRAVLLRQGMYLKLLLQILYLSFIVIYQQIIPLLRRHTLN